MKAHGALVKAVIAYIGARHGIAWKNQAGTLPVGGRYVHVGKRGLPDVVGVMPGGRLIAVEVKTGTGRVRAHQQAMHEELRKRGALVVTVRKITDLEEVLR